MIEPAGPWRVATVVEVRKETATAKTFRLALDRPSLHLAGQHYVLRLTAPDGYTASRSYSVASAPDGGAFIELTVERLADGEVSTFLHDEVVPGDELEVRGPIGRWFVWEPGTPALLIGGGSGVVPLMAMLRLARRLAHVDDLHLVVSVRRPDDLYYASEIAGPETSVVYTRAAPSGYARAPGRLTLGDLPPAWTVTERAYICGSSPFADHATGLVLEAGLKPQQVRVERFGPS